MAITRRQFIKRSLTGAAGLAVVGGVYSAIEASWIRVAQETIPVSKLPSAFKGIRIAFLTDIHHGPWTSLAYVKQIVQTANNLSPDVILLGGDYVHRSPDYIDPCFDALSHLRAKFGVFGVLGNHDHWEGAPETRTAMSRAAITELTNEGVWLKQSGSRLRIAGVGDFWSEDQDIDAALDDTDDSETAILISHNPDYAEFISDPRVGLVLSGHTHGGQVVLPVVGAPIVPSRFGQKYLRGLVRAPKTQVFVSRGLGTITPPLRFCCRPEINLITLS